MSRRVVLWLAPGATLALGVVLWWAAAFGGATDFHSQGGDPCATCHSLATASGWIGTTSSPGATNWAAKPGAVKCYWCHQTGSATGARDVFRTAMGEGGSLVHLYRVVDQPPNLDGTVGTISPQWYRVGTGGGELECVTCHDVHSRTNRPYLARVSAIEALCDDCHKRGWSGAKAGANITTFGRSTHPEGVPYTFNGNNGEAFPTAFVYRQVGGTVDVTKSFSESVAIGTSELWNLGGHLGPSGFVECQTCHAVHGGEDYPPVSGAGRPPEPGLLVAPIVGNPAGATSNATPKASICQACHKGGDAGETVQPATAAYGTPTKDHPVGARAINYIAVNRHATAADDDSSNKTGAGTGWARYWGNDGTHNDVVLCVTCHDVHGGLNATPLYRRSSMLADGTTAQTAARFCETCHLDASPLAHHSNRGVLVTSLIGCEDCHGSPGTLGYQAHGDFFQVFYAPAADVVRAIPQTIGTITYTVAQIRRNSESALCGFCHNPADPSNFALTNAPVTTTALVGEASLPSRHGMDRGSASHWLGVDTDQMRATEFRIGTVWPGSQYYSKYGGGATGGGNVPPANVVKGTSTIICESCHNLRYNDGQRNPGSYSDARRAGYESNLLLQPYRDDCPGTGDGVDRDNAPVCTPPFTDGDGTDSTLCVGCHSAPGFAVGEHHPLTGETVSYTGQPLKTVAGRANAPGAPNAVSYPAPNRMDCDSCHRPHDAADGSNVPAGRYGKTRPAFYSLEMIGTAPRYDFSTTLCAQCHSY